MVSTKNLHWNTLISITQYFIDVLEAKWPETDDQQLTNIHFSETTALLQNLSNFASLELRGHEFAYLPSKIYKM